MAKQTRIYQSCFIVWIIIIKFCGFGLLPVWYLSKYGLAHNFELIVFSWIFIMFLYCLHEIYKYRGTYFVFNLQGLEITYTHRIFKYSREHINFEKISSFQVVQSGLFSTLFNFGNIQIFTVGNTHAVTLKNISNAEEQLKNIKLNYSLWVDQTTQVK